MQHNGHQNMTPSLAEVPTGAEGGPFKVLQRYYTDRSAAAHEVQSHGVGVVGRVGNTIPSEFIMASGRLPVLIAADMGQPTPTADVYMEPVIPPETKSLFEIALSGEFESFHLLVLSRPYAHLYYYLKEVYRLGRAAKVPPLHMFDLMQSQRDAVRSYNSGRIRALLEQLERLAGAAITDDRLEAAISLTNRVRALQRELLERRWRAELTGVDAMQALGAGYFMPSDAYADTLAGYLADLQPRTDLNARPRLLLIPSEPLSHLRLHETIEAAGALVVAEDDWWGSRAAGADVQPGGSPVEAVLRKYWLDTPTANVYPAEAREQWFMQQVAREDVEAVVFYLPPSDHQLGWDYPRLKAHLDSIGKPSLLVRHDAATSAGRDVISGQVKPWLEALR
jgi:benzoyl-CoA reductase/2-hydroxyglutaryl-CoA dehydratase subunit BcrC/BadD/HgdB